MAVSFIGGGNQRTRRNHRSVALCCTPRPDPDSTSQHQWWREQTA